MKMTAPSYPARTGVWIGIATITMSFAAYTSALIVRQSSGGDWQHVALPSILYANTLLLLASSGTLEAGRRRLEAAWTADPAGNGHGMRNESQGRRWLSVTMAVGLLFIAGQITAWRALAAEGLFLATNPASDFFYILTALHGLHLLGGVLALGYVMARLRPSDDVPPRAALSAASLYWHFMTVLWLYLLLVLTTRL